MNGDSGQFTASENLGLVMAVCFFHRYGEKVICTTSDYLEDKGKLLKVCREKNGKGSSKK